MTPAETVKSSHSTRRRVAEIALLLAATGVAVAVALYLFLSGDADPDSPTEVVQRLYDAVADDNLGAYDAVLDPEVRDDPARFVIPFGTATGPFEVGTGREAEIRELNLREIAKTGSWATVDASGQVRVDGNLVLLGETIYLRQVGAQWRVSTPAEYARSVAPGIAPSTVPGLGPIDGGRPNIGQPAPNFALEDARDTAIVRQLADYRGTPVVLNWYADWCDPCRREIPTLDAAQRSLGDAVVILGVNFGESQSDALNYLNEFEVAYPAVLDRDYRVSNQYRVSNMPTTYFIDGDGIVRDVVLGEIRAEQLAEKLAELGLTYTPR